MSDSNFCPMCGASGNDLLVNELSETKQLDFFQAIAVVYKQEVCKECGFVGEHENSYEEAYLSSKKVSDQFIVKKLIDNNRQNGIKDAYFERGFSLPSRTLYRWKSGTDVPNAAAISLMKLVNTYDWLLDVADNGYNPEFAKQILKVKAVEDMKKDREELGVATIDANFKHGDGAITYIKSSSSFEMTPTDGTSNNFYTNYYIPNRKAVS